MVFCVFVLLRLQLNLHGNMIGERGREAIQDLLARFSDKLVTLEDPLDEGMQY